LLYLFFTYAADEGIAAFKRRFPGIKIQR